MTKDDIPLLSRWLIYHGHVFGFEHLYIFDGSQGDQQAYLAHAARLFPIHVRHSLVDLNAIHGDLVAWMVEIQEAYEWIIKVDTDEFVAWAPKGVLDVRAQRRLPGHWAQRIELMKVDWVFNVEPVESGSPTETERADLVEVAYGSYKQIYSGPRFRSSSFNLGSHSFSEDAAVPGLAIVHYHNRSYEEMIRLATQAIIGHGYISVTDSRAQRLEKLSRFPARPSCTVSSCHKLWILLDDLLDRNNTRDAYLANIGTTPPTLRHWRDYLREIYKTYPYLLSSD